MPIIGQYGQLPLASNLFNIDAASSFVVPIVFMVMVPIVD